MENMKYDNSALFIIDIQEDYTGTTAQSPFPYRDSEKLITNVNKMIEKADKKNIIIVYIRQEFDGFIGRVISKLAGHSIAIKGSTGAELDRRIRIISDHCFTKLMPDAFSNAKLETFLKKHGVKQLYITGLEGTGCVYFTVKGALKRGYNISIVKDSIVSLNEKKWDKILKKFEQSGIEMITSDEF
jgi:nicotinamidase-related amidase